MLRELSIARAIGRSSTVRPSRPLTRRGEQLVTAARHWEGDLILVYEVQKYVSGNNHVCATNPVQISKRFWDRLSPV